MRRGVVVVAALVAALAPACSRGGDGDDGFRLVLRGRADVGDEAVGDGEHTVTAGDEIRMTRGTAVLELPGDRSVLLRAGVGERESSVVTVGERPEVVAGDAVVVAEEETTFRAGDVEVRVRDGAARVQRALSVTVGMYAGDADVRASGRLFEGGLPPLRQLSVPATGVLPREAVPLVYDERAPDPWDLRFLGDAIDLGIELDDRSSGYTGQLGPGAQPDPDALRVALPELPTVPAVVVTDRTPGEALVGAAIAVEAGGEEAIASVFSFRDAGAKWGLVALDQRVQRDRLLGRIASAIGRSPELLFAVGPGGGVRPTTPTTTPSGGTTPTTTPASTPTTTPSSGGSTPTVPSIPTPTLPSIPGLPEIPLLPQPETPEQPDGSSPPTTDPTSPTLPPPPPVTEIVDTAEQVVGGIIDDLLPDAGGLL